MGCGLDTRLGSFVGVAVILVGLLGGCTAPQRSAGGTQTGMCVASLGGGSNRRTAVVEAVARAAPAVVSVVAEERPRYNPFGFFGLDPDDDSVGNSGAVGVALGSGVIVDDQGHVVTNEHVVSGAARIKVRLNDGRELPATLVGADQSFDLAVLQVDAGRQRLPHISESPAELLIGETAIAIGNPFGLSHTVTTGVISAIHRTVRTRNRVYEDFIQTDAPINPGNSGGPLLNINGELVGINTAVHSGGPGIGFAIPTTRVRRVVRDLVQFSRVRPGWLGLEIAGRARRPAGVVIGEVEPGGPAMAAGLRVGDVIVSLGDVPTPTRTAFFDRAHLALAGEVVTVKTQRGEHALKVGELQPEQAAARLRQRLGAELTDAGGRAVLVTGVARDRGAQRAGIQPGDVLLQVGLKTVRTVSEFDAALAGYTLGSDVVMLVARAGTSHYATVSL
mgnify:CR=1 FL=1